MSARPTRPAPDTPPDARGAQPPQSEVWAKWEEEARNTVVSEMRRQNVSYKVLSARLEALGIDETPDRLNRKVNRKRFSAAFLLACLSAMDVVLGAGNVPPDRGASAT